MNNYNKIISTPASVDMRIQFHNPDNFNSLEAYQQWDMAYGSTELKRMCAKLNWNMIEELLDHNVFLKKISKY